VNSADPDALFAVVYLLHPALSATFHWRLACWNSTNWAAFYTRINCILQRVLLLVSSWLACQIWLMY